MPRGQGTSQGIRGQGTSPSKGHPKGHWTPQDIPLGTRDILPLGTSQGTGDKGVPPPRDILRDKGHPPPGHPPGDKGHRPSGDIPRDSGQGTSPGTRDIPRDPLGDKRRPWGQGTPVRTWGQETPSLGTISWGQGTSLGTRNPREDMGTGDPIPGDHLLGTRDIPGDKGPPWVLLHMGTLGTLGTGGT